MRRQPGHLCTVDKAGLHAATVRVLDMRLEGGHPLGCEGQQQAANLAKTGVVPGLLLEVQEQVYGVPDRAPHERGGPDLSDQPGGLGGRLVEECIVALQNLDVRTTSPRQVVGGAQSPDTAAHDHNARSSVHSVPRFAARLAVRKRPGDHAGLHAPGRTAGPPQFRSFSASVYERSWASATGSETRSPLSVESPLARASSSVAAPSTPLFAIWIR